LRPSAAHLFRRRRRTDCGCERAASAIGAREGGRERTCTSPRARERETETGRAPHTRCARVTQGALWLARSPGEKSRPVLPLPLPRSRAPPRRARCRRSFVLYVSGSFHSGFRSFSLSQLLSVYECVCKKECVYMKEKKRVRIIPSKKTDRQEERARAQARQKNVRAPQNKTPSLSLKKRPLKQRPLSLSRS
jgi:hypothetical protein